MAAYTCKHCGASNNMHQRCSQTCSCGRPVTDNIMLIRQNLKDLPADFVDLRNRYGGMCYYERQVFLNGNDYKWEGHDVFADKEGIMYILGGYEIKTTAADVYDFQMKSYLYDSLAQLEPESTLDEALAVVMKHSKGKLNPKKAMEELIYIAKYSVCNGSEGGV